MGHRPSQHHPCTILHPTPISNTTLASFLWLLVLALVTLFSLAGATDAAPSSISQHQIYKRSVTEGNMGAADYPDYQSGVRYDEYPVVVPKRTALLLDRIMVALQKAVEDEKGAGRNYAPDLAESKMDLQRRGQTKGRVYWRCYFNAVTCF